MEPSDIIAEESQLGISPPNRSDLDDFERYIKSGSIEGAKKCLDSIRARGGNVNTPLSTIGDTLLWWAAFRDNTDTMQYLLQQDDADVNARDDTRQTPLMVAAKLGNNNAMNFLLDRSDIEIDWQDSLGETALMRAVEYAEIETTKLLLQYGALRSPRNWEGLTAIGLMLKNKSEAGSRAEFESEAGWTDSHYERYPEIRKIMTEIPGSPLPPSRLQGNVTMDLKLDRAFYIHSVAPNVLGINHWSSLLVLQPDMKLIYDKSRYNPNEFSEQKTQSGHWKWIHVPANNILWAKWVAESLTAAHAEIVNNDTNMIAEIDAAVTEVNKSRCARQFHWKTFKSDKGTYDCCSIVLPYLSTESEDFLEYARSSDAPQGAAKVDELVKNQPIRFKDLDRRAKIAEANGAPLGVKSFSQGTRMNRYMHNPQTLDRFESSVPGGVDERDADQVLYRFTNDQKATEVLRNKDSSPHLLTVGQLWLWKINNIVITAFPKPWSIQSEDTLRLRVETACKHGLIKQSKDLVDVLTSMCLKLPDEPGSWGLPSEESWITIFEKSIQKARFEEEEHLRKLGADLKAKDSETLYNIASEVEALRKAKDISDELRLIGRVYEIQKLVIQAKHASLQEPDEASVQRVELLKRQREKLNSLKADAAAVERRWNQLLDLKQKQGSLEQVRQSVIHAKELAIQNEELVKQTKHSAEQADFLAALGVKADERNLENERQSAYLFVFTIITIIFAPLNFVAAFFAIPSTDFPQMGSGSDQKVNWDTGRIIGGLVASLIITFALIGIWYAVLHFYSLVYGKRRQGKKAAGEASKNIAKADGQEHV
ncbi:hypothetical protein BT63DRAFT_426779 [Microthyrium microscopicum]|uniref:Uncharacterized protein n=1 Tax=Microthyrium microscopicum TaxID=703497 RepID=A0A6A6U8H9_9PEZI|nr:hypothetical protein BT63DRAFT_426779 [Microthyrium microscopicum]